MKPLSTSEPAASHPLDHEISYRWYLLVGGLAIVAFLGGAGSWASLAQMSGAIVAAGTVTVDGKTKPVQHLTGGIVEEIFVEDGDVVAASSVLLRLDDTSLRAQLSQVERRIVE